MLGDEFDGSLGILSFGNTLFPCLNSVVHRVSNHVDEGVIELFDDGLVQLGLCSLSDQLDVLVHIGRQVVDQSAEAGEDGADGKHTHVHGIVPQGDDEPLALLAEHQQCRIVCYLCMLAQACVEGYQLSHQVDELVQLV